MAFVFHRQLDIPLWPVAFFAVALIAPPATLFLIAIVGIGAIAFTTAGLVPWLRTSRSIAHVVSHSQCHKRNAAASDGTRVRTVDEANVNAAEDPLDLVRMDDDGGWQMARPPA